jgi:hypothetical protein
MHLPKSSENNEVLIAIDIRTKSWISRSEAFHYLMLISLPTIMGLVVDYLHLDGWRKFVTHLEGRFVVLTSKLGLLGMIGRNMESMILGCRGAKVMFRESRISSLQSTENLMR